MTLTKHGNTKQLKQVSALEVRVRTRIQPHVQACISMQDPFPHKTWAETAKVEGQFSAELETRKTFWQRTYT